MNIISRKKSRKKTDIFDPGVMLRKARRLFRKNKLHESENILLKLKHHGYNTPEIELLLARVYDKLAFLTSEIEFELKAKEAYNEIIQYCPRKRYVKRAGKLLENMKARVALLNDNEHRAHFKAGEYARNEPRSPKAWFILGANFSTQKDPGFVIDAYMKAVSLHENYILALYRIGYIYQYNLADYDSALKYYHRLVKIPPYEDSIEPESVNVKTILEACNEMTEIYCSMDKCAKILSVFDHTIKIYRTYSDICTPHNIKRTIINTRYAAMTLNKYSALVKYCSEHHKTDFEAILDELGMM